MKEIEWTEVCKFQKLSPSFVTKNLFRIEFPKVNKTELKKFNKVFKKWHEKGI